MAQNSVSATASLRAHKRSDLVAEEVKRLITERDLAPGDKLPREIDLQAQFAVSKGTIREALKSLEVQGLVRITTGPGGGATIAQVPLERTLQLMQNYLFFQNITFDDVYAVRTALEPELAAAVVPHLTQADFEALEHSIACCSPAPGDSDLVAQRREDLRFHDILAAACPNPFLRFVCELINEMIRHLIVYSHRTTMAEHRRFGAVNVQFHADILAAARRRDADSVRRLMAEHMTDAASTVKRMRGRIQGRLILDAEVFRPRASTVVKRARERGGGA